MELPPGEFALLVENDPADTPGHLEALRKRFPLATVSDFADPRARNSTASMILYAAKLSRDPAAEPAYREDVAVLDADALRDDPKLTDALWALYGERFDWLGRHHPLSMEESQESFNSALFHHGTRTLVKFERDEPVCVGVFMIGLDECGWFAPACRAELEAQAAAEDANLIYFYGIAGTPGSGTAHTAELMSAFARTLWEYGKPCRLVFEATNLSSRYVPTLVTRNVRATPYGDFARGGDLDVLARVDYWYLDVR